MSSDRDFDEFSRSKVKRCGFSHFLGLYSPDWLAAAMFIWVSGVVQSVILLSCTRALWPKSTWTSTPGFIAAPGISDFIRRLKQYKGNSPAGEV